MKQEDLQPIHLGMMEIVSLSAEAKQLLVVLVENDAFEKALACDPDILLANARAEAPEDAEAMEALLALSPEAKAIICTCGETMFRKLLNHKLTDKGRDLARQGRS